jgi:hypothetical protein
MSRDQPCIGIPLTTQVAGGSVAGTGDELLIATVPAALLATAGTATITVVNPAPGGELRTA